MQCLLFNTLSTSVKGVIVHHRLQIPVHYVIMGAPDFMVIWFKGVSIINSIGCVWDCLL